MDGLFMGSAAGWIRGGRRVLDGWARASTAQGIQQRNDGWVLARVLDGLLEQLAQRKAVLGVYRRHLLVGTHFTGLHHVPPHQGEDTCS